MLFQPRIPGLPRILHLVCWPGLVHGFGWAEVLIRLELILSPPSRTRSLFAAGMDKPVVWSPRGALHASHEWEWGAEKTLC